MYNSSSLISCWFFGSIYVFWASRWVSLDVSTGMSGVYFTLRLPRRNARWKNEEKKSPEFWTFPFLRNHLFLSNQEIILSHHWSQSFPISKKYFFVYNLYVIREYSCILLCDFFKVNIKKIALKFSILFISHLWEHRLIEPFQKCENSRFYFMSMISFVGFNIISGWYQDKRFVGFLLPTSLFLFWTKKTLKWEIALGESRTALRTALSHMLFQTFGEGRNYSFGWDWNFLFEKEIFLVYTLIRIPKTRIQVQSNKDNIFNRKSAKSHFSKSSAATSWP